MKENVIKSRILTACIALPLLIAFILWAPPWGFFCLTYAVAGWALYEYYAMALAAGRSMEKYLGIVAGIGLMVPLVLGHYAVFVGCLIASVFLFACVFLFRHGAIDKVSGQLALLLFGFIYISIPLAHLALLRSQPHGIQWVLLVLMMVMLNDTCAYFTGTFFGRRKLYPSVSPKKSVEGAIGGLGGSVLAAGLAHLTFAPWAALVPLLLLGLVVGVIAELGDLFESLLKRSFGVKDSGTLIPGHGGILDRLDSLMFAFPLTYYFILIFQV
ncbi:phosphatidate cytidylyltransferase [Syntrophotalea carbinolica]|uniref:phosphatidate cytidylyltransferase n=1 Tax=Syntrophotalea carbinolica TaxID=19 RepID=UPI003159BEBD